MAADGNKLEKFIEITNKHEFDSLEDYFSWFDMDPANKPDSNAQQYIVINEGMWSNTEPLLKVLYAVGMPRDLQLVEVFLSGRNYSDKYRDYIVNYVGILADDDDPDRGKTQASMRYTVPDGETTAEVNMHFWVVRLLVRNVRAQFIKTWNSGYSRGNIRPPVNAKDTSLKPPQMLVRQGWSDDVLNVSSDRPNDLKAIADGLILLNSDHIINSYIAKTGHGGWRYQKVPNLTEDKRKELGKKYVELKALLRNVKRDAKTFASAKNVDWRESILDKYEILKKHLDLVEYLDSYKIPTDAEASDREREQWEIAIEIAARETIPGYKHNSVGADALRRAALVPGDKKK